MSYKYIIFDRDGTLNKTAENAGGYVLHVNQMRLLPGAKHALNALYKEGVRAFVFTQQSCIGKGLLETETLTKIHQKMQSLIGVYTPIEKFYFCPHVKEDMCDCRKPKPGMLTECLEDFHLLKKDVLVVGDSIRDYKCAQTLGLDFAFIYNVKHSKEEYAEFGCPVFDDLPALVRHYYNIDPYDNKKENGLYIASVFLILLEIIVLFAFAMTYSLT